MHRHAPLYTLISILTVQLICTAIDLNFYPFCSYNMFNSIPADHVWQFRVNVIDGNGDSQSVHPGRLMPTEFFKASYVLEKIFVNPAVAPETKRAVWHRIVRRLSEQRWQGFDEIYPALPWKAGSTFEIELVRATVDSNFKLQPGPSREVIRERFGTYVD